MGFVNLSGGESAHRFKHAGKTGLLSVHPAGQHGAAADENGGDVYPGGCHQKAGYILVAVGNHYQAVKAVGLDHCLGGVSDQIPGDQGVFHALVAHGDAVAHGDGGEDNGGAAGHGYAQLHRFHNLVQIHVAGNDFIVGADNADEGPLLLFLGQAQGMVQTAVRGILGTVDDGIFDHGRNLLSVLG